MSRVFVCLALAVSLALNGCDVSNSAPAVPSLASFQTDLKRGCDAAKAWAEAKGDTLPTSWTALSTLPPEYRTQVMDRLTAPGRMAIWIAQLDYYIREGSEMTQPQRAALADLRNALRPTMFEPGSSELVEAVDLEALQVLLGRETSRRVLFDVGYPFQPDVLGGAAQGLNGVSQSSLTTTHNSTPQQICNCNNQDGNYCETYFGPGAGCYSNGGCDSTPTGCGPFDTASCTGKCSQEPGEPLPIDDTYCDYNPCETDCSQNPYSNQCQCDVYPGREGCPGSGGYCDLHPNAPSCNFGDQV